MFAMIVYQLDRALCTYDTIDDQVTHASKPFGRRSQL